MANSFLRYLAKYGKTNIHPKGVQATELLLHSFDIREGHHFLEIGCGTGETLVRLRSRTNVEVTAIDLLPEMVAVSQKRLRFVGLKAEIRGIQEGAIFPFSNSSFDGIYCESVLGIQDKKQLHFMLEQIYQKLKKGGKFIANEAIWRDHVTTQVANRLNENCLLDFGVRQASKEALKLEDWLAIFEKVGFTIHSYKLLESYDLNSIKISNNKEIYLSKLFTFYKKALNAFDIQFYKERKNYLKSLKKHREDGQSIEHRFFILSK